VALVGEFPQCCDLVSAGFSPELTRQRQAHVFVLANATAFCCGRDLDEDVCW
jgi:hypothetical protein